VNNSLEKNCNPETEFNMYPPNPKSVWFMTTEYYLTSGKKKCRNVM